MIKYDLLGNLIKPEIMQLRIPYMGSKNKIASNLLLKMLEIKPKAKYFFDLFAGGGSMSFAALQFGLKVHYNEKQKGMVDLLNYILTAQKGKFGIFPDDFYEFITREEFDILKNEDSLKGQFARICYSFGNNQKGYLFGDIENFKRLGHNIVVFQCKKSLRELNKLIKSNLFLSEAENLNDRRLDFIKQISAEFKGGKKEELRRLQQLERLQRLERLPRLTITNLDYKEVKIKTPIDETIVYLDPPYRGTASYLEDALHAEIDDYFRLSPYTCFMSEYNAPFDCVLEIEKAKTLDNTKGKKRTYAIEKLFINKK